MSESVVVWWTIDSLRQDISSVYGGEAETPTLNRLVERGQAYDCRSKGTWTLPSVTTMLTGLPPEEHEVQTQDDRLKPGTPTLPQHFRKHGWRTLGVVANPWFTRRKGLDIGFDKFYNIVENSSIIRQVSVSSLISYFTHAQSRTGGLTLDMSCHPSEPLIADLASEWVNSVKKPVFAMVHTEGVHSPYHSPSAWDSHQDQSSIRKADYLNLAEFVDAQLGRFLDRLPQDVIIIVTSDHGEALGEAGEWGHGGKNNEILYDVPLIIAGTKPQFAGQETVSHIDIHKWLREDVAPIHQENVRSAELQKHLTALGYTDGTHSV